MLPYISLLGTELDTYSLMAILGLLVAGFIFCRRITEERPEDKDAVYLLFVIAFGMYAGGHVLFFITQAQNWHLLFTAESPEKFSEIFSRLSGGSVFYGGLIGAFLLGLLYLKIRRVPNEVYLDSAALFAPVFHGFARIGCLLAGCCYGVESEFGLPLGEAVRFPVQLLESACNFAIAAVIFFVLKKGVLRGKVFYLYLALYAFVRFFDEFLRGDEIRGFIFGLSTSQFISIFVEAFALAMLLVPFIRKKLKT